MSGFAMFCMSDGTLGDPGVHQVWGPFETRASRHLAFEASPLPEQTYGYAGGSFGSAVKTANGYLVAWASRGVRTPISNRESPDAAYNSHEPALVVLNSSGEVVERDWPFFPLPRTQPPKADAVNVHAAPYGADKVLLVWETIEEPQFEPGMQKLGEGISTGLYGGTHFRFVDAGGKLASDEEVVLRAIAPNGPDDILQLANGDLLWAYVPESQRDFTMTVSNAALPNLAPISEIRFVRLLYCPP
jgi:hypothetical protein